MRPCIQEDDGDDGEGDEELDGGEDDDGDDGEGDGEGGDYEDQEREDGDLSDLGKLRCASEPSV